jgi:hypothetical protein
VTSPLEESSTFVPLSLIRRGGVIIEEGLVTLLNTLKPEGWAGAPLKHPTQSRARERQKRGEASLT